MAVKIQRKEYVNEVNLYEVELDDNFMAELNHSFRDFCMESLPPITVEDIVLVMEKSDVDWPDYLCRHYNWSLFAAGEEHVFKMTLAEYITQYLNEELWMAYVEPVCSDTDYWEDAVIK